MSEQTDGWDECYKAVKEAEEAKSEAALLRATLEDIKFKLDSRGKIFVQDGSMLTKIDEMVTTTLNATYAHTHYRELKLILEIARSMVRKGSSDASMVSFLTLLEKTIKPLSNL